MGGQALLLSIAPTLGVPIASPPGFLDGTGSSTRVLTEAQVVEIGRLIDIAWSYTLYWSAQIISDEIHTVRLSGHDAEFVHRN